MARFCVDPADYEAAVLYTAMQCGLKTTLDHCLAQDLSDPIKRGVHEHFERSFWHLVRMMQRLYPPRR